MGSEMCIRDSQSRVDRSAGSSAWPAVLFATAGLLLLMSQLFFEPQLKGAAFVVDRSIGNQRLSTAMWTIAALSILYLFRWAWQRSANVNWGRAVLVVLVLELVSMACCVIGDRWHLRYSNHYNRSMQTKVFSYIRKNVEPGERFCCTAPRSYPFLSSRRQFKLMQAHRTPAQPSRFASVDAFLQYLLEYEVDTVVVHKNQLQMFTQEQQQEWDIVSRELLRVYWADASFQLMKVDPKLIASHLSDQADMSANRIGDE